jgi:hypothetical protein
MARQRKDFIALGSKQSSPQNNIQRRVKYFLTNAISPPKTHSNHALSQYDFLEFLIKSSAERTPDHPTVSFPFLIKPHKLGDWRFSIFHTMLAFRSGFR